MIPEFFKKIYWRPYLLSGAIVDPQGFGFFNLMLENACIPRKYRYMFCPPNDNAVFVDCGVNVGLVIDIARFNDMEVYAFEPNPQAVRLLNKKYIHDKMVHIYPNAVSNKNGKMIGCGQVLVRYSANRIVNVLKGGEIGYWRQD